MAERKNHTFAQVMGNKEARSSRAGESRKKPLFAHMEFNSETEDLVRFQKAFVGEVENTGMTYNRQESFNVER